MWRNSHQERSIKVIAAMDCFVEIVTGFIADNAVIIMIILVWEDFQAKVSLVFLSINTITAAVSNQIERSSTVLLQY